MLIFTSYCRRNYAENSKEIVVLMFKYGIQVFRGNLTNRVLPGYYFVKNSNAREVGEVVHLSKRSQHWIFLDPSGL